MFVFWIVALLTISNISQALSEDSSEESDGPKLDYGGIRFTTANGNVCRGIIITKEWSVVDPKCNRNSKKIHVTKIAGKTVSIDIDIAESHLTTDPQNPDKHYFELMKATKPITNQEFNYLPVNGVQTWENVKKTSENMCANPSIYIFINTVISKTTGVSQKLCSQSFDDKNVVHRRS